MQRGRKRVGGLAYRRVGVCKASSTSLRPPGHYSRAEKHSYFPRRRYAHTPNRRHASQPPPYYKFVGSSLRSTGGGVGKSTGGGCCWRSSGPAGSARRTSGGGLSTGRARGAGVQSAFAWTSCGGSLGRGFTD